MSCTRPLKGFVHHGKVVFERPYPGAPDVELPCGRCAGCYRRRISDEQLRLIHEARLHSDSLAATLTYRDDALPPLRSLSKRHFQLFLKRLRSVLAKRGIRIRFHAVGEYSPVLERPHVHLTLFGWWPEDARYYARSKSGNPEFASEVLSSAWSHGLVTFQRFDSKSARYVAQHQASKLKGRRGESALLVVGADGLVEGQRQSEWRLASLRPGLGAGFFERFRSDVVPWDFCVLDGKKRAVPRYYQAVHKRLDLVEFERLREARMRLGQEAYERSITSHGSRERYLAAHEAVTEARDRFESSSVKRSGTERAR